MGNRGRIQAQGDKIEISETWSKNEPPTRQEGLDMLDKLKDKLSKKETKIREKPFEKVARFIKNGPYKVVNKMISKTFMVADSNHERVDIEIIKGTAFTNDKELSNE